MRLLAFLAFILPAIVSAEEWWAWTLLDVWREPPWSAGLALENRLDFEEGAYFQMVSPRTRYQALPWLEAGLSLSVLSIENTTTEERYWQFRPELELNPKFELTDFIRLEWRNRMEWRLNEGDTFTTHRLRHRLQLAWMLSNPVGPLTRVFASNEWLVDLHRREWTENRFAPLGVTFQLTPASDLDVFYMLVSRRGPDDWEGESVLGTNLRVRF